MTQHYRVLALVLLTFATPQVSAESLAAAIKLARPGWSIESLVEEATLVGDERPISLLDGRLRTRVRSTRDVQVWTVDEGDFLQVHLGVLAAPINCLFHADPGYTALLVSELSNNAIKAVLEEEKAQLDSKEVRTWTLDHVGIRPVLFVYWKFKIVTSDGNKKNRFLKTAVSLVDDTLVSCTHAQHGNAPNFLAVFSHLIQNAKVSSATQKPFFQELSVMRSDGLPTRFFRTRYFATEKDGVKVATDVGNLWASSTKIAVMDSREMQQGSVSGELLRQSYAAHYDGVTIADLELYPIDDRTWVVDGSYAREPLSASLESDTLLYTASKTVSLMKEMISDPTKDTVELQTWLPILEPTKLYDMKIEQIDDSRSARYTIDGTSMRIELAMDGTIERMHGRVEGIEGLPSVDTEIVRVATEGQMPAD